MDKSVPSVKTRAFVGSGLITLCVLLVAAVFLFAVGQRIPSAGDCADLWNRSSNVENQRSVIRFDEARAAGWDTKAGPHCSVHFFTRPGAPWAMYVLWLAAPGGASDSFHEDIGGTRYGRGELGAEEPLPANASVGGAGRIALRSPSAAGEDV